MNRRWLFAIAALVMVVALGLTGAQADVNPPDMSVCDGVGKCDAPDAVCSAGFEITLTSFVPAPTSNSGTGTYTYKVCSPVAGQCSNNISKACLANSECGGNCNQQKHTCSNTGAACSTDNDCQGTCSRACAVDNFRGLSHFDVPLTGSCMGTASVTGTCSVGNFVMTDGSCFSSSDKVAKCDNTNLEPGQCLTMSVSIAGETNDLGKGPTVVVDKESTSCSASCIQGPSCTPCKTPPSGEECLTRTIGFWGTHPWITNDYAPVDVCGNTLTCAGTDLKGESDPACLAGSCSSVMEGIGSIPSEYKENQSYVAMVKQLTAAELNLKATAALVDGAQCSGFSYDGKGIMAWIDYCESLCGADKATISRSGCIEALDAFNNSEDAGFAQTPAPFNAPGIDDYGHTSGADPSQFTAAQKNGYVIGKNAKYDCRQ